MPVIRNSAFFLNKISEFNAPQSPQPSPSAEQSEASSGTGVSTATIIAGVIAFMIVLIAAGAGFIYYRSQKRPPTSKAAKRAAPGKHSNDAGSRRGSLGSRGSSASLGSVASVGSVGSIDSLASVDTVATPGRHIHVLYI